MLCMYLKVGKRVFMYCMFVGKVILVFLLFNMVISIFERKGLFVYIDYIIIDEESFF